MTNTEKPLTDKEKRVMLHALGEPIDRPPVKGKPYRNYYFDLQENPIWEEIAKNCYCIGKTASAVIWILVGILVAYRYTDARFSSFGWWSIFLSVFVGSFCFARREWDSLQNADKVKDEVR